MFVIERFPPLTPLIKHRIRNVGNVRQIKQKFVGFSFIQSSKSVILGGSYRKCSWPPQPIRLQQLRKLLGPSGFVSCSLLLQSEMCSGSQMSVKTFDWRNFMIYWAQRIFLESNAILFGWNYTILSHALLKFFCKICS